MSAQQTEQFFCATNVKLRGFVKILLNLQLLFNCTIIWAEKKYRHIQKKHMKLS